MIRRAQKVMPACSRRLVRMSTSSARPAPLTKFSGDEEQLRDMVHKFAEQEIKPLVQQMDENAALDEGLKKSLFENGLLGIEVPEKYGGSGMTFVQSVLAIEEISRIDPAVAVMVDVQNTLVNTAILKFGTEEQRQKYLPKLSSESVGSFSLSESSSASDAFALKCRADKQGDEYILNGEKMWVSNAAEAEFFIVFANVDFEKKHRGITAFMVERSNPGFTVGNKEGKLGIRASSTCPLFLTDCKVKATDILGNVGEGYKIAIGSLNEGRIGIASQMVGLAQGAFDHALPYVHDRKTFGKSVASFQGVQFSVAKARTDIEAARLLTMNAARLKESGHPFISEACMAKYYASVAAERVASQAIEWCGGIGFTREFGLEKFYRDAKIGSIYEGTTNIQLQTIAKELEKEFKGTGK